MTDPKRGPDRSNKWNAEEWRERYMTPEPGAEPNTTWCANPMRPGSYFERAASEALEMVEQQARKDGERGS